MKSKVVGLMSLLTFIAVGAAHATSFTNTVDLNQSGTWNGATYTQISDSNGDGFVGQYSHALTFDPAAASINNVSLQLTFALANETTGPSSNPQAKEVWLISESGGSQSIGTLTAPNDNYWHDQTFTLDSGIFSGISGTNWTIAFRFNETTQATDTFYLDKSILFGDYTEVTAGGGDNGPAPVPEPASMMLLGAGFLALAISRKRRRNI